MIRVHIFLSGRAGIPTTAFSLGMGDGTTKDYTYSPAERGPDSVVINIASNDPADLDGHDITLDGLGVGPVFASDTPPGGTLDFGPVGDGDVASLFLLVENVTPDVAPVGLTDLTLNVAVPVGLPYQTLLSEAQFSQPPTRTAPDRWGQPCAVFELGRVPGGGKATVTFSIEVEVSAIRYLISVSGLKGFG